MAAKRRKEAQRSGRFFLRLLALFCGQFLGVTSSPGAEPVELKLATILPAGTSGHQCLMELRDGWTKSSASTVKLTVYAGAESEGQLVKKLRAKQIHAALLSVVGLREIDPAVSSLQLMPMMFRDWREVDHVREKIRPDLEARLAARGFVVLFWADAGWVRYFSKEPAQHPDEFRRMKMFVWAGEPQQVQIMRSLGYQPVGLETDQVVTGLATNMISVVPVPPFLANALQYGRHTPHMLDVPWVPIVGAAIVQREAWEKIPASQRTALLQHATQIGEKLRQRTRAEDDDAINALKKRGLTVHSASPEVLVAWRALAEKTYPMIRGSLVPADVFDAVRQELADFRTAHGTTP